MLHPGPGRARFEGLESRVLLATFTVTTTANSGAGSLRQAIIDANASSGADVIEFDIADTNRQIRVTSALPQITESLTIDGTSQDGYTNKPLVELHGKDAGASTHGLNATGGSLALRGLAITSFSASGIVLDSGSSGSTIESSHIGIDPSGKYDRGNLGSGITIVGSSNNTIGGLDRDQANIIAYNGRTKSGGVPGVLMYGGGTGNAVLGCSIFSNRGAGIDLVQNGNTADGALPPNDNLDADTGTNNLQNKPSLIFAGLSQGETHAIGSINSEPNKTYRIELFANPALNTGSIQAQTFVAAKSVTTDANGYASIDIDVLIRSSGAYYTATATDPDNNTSEISIGQSSKAGSISGVVYDDLNGNGVRETGEPAFPNQLVWIDFNNDGSPQGNEPSRLTSSTGAYTFEELAGGPQRVRVLISTGRRISQPAAGYWELTLPTDKGTKNRNFGLTTLAVMRGAVFNDADGDGIRDSGESNLSGWTVFLDKDNDGILDSNEKVRVTNSLGEFRFADLPPGTYTLRVVLQNGFTATTATAKTIKLTAAQTLSNRLFGVQSA